MPFDLVVVAEEWLVLFVILFVFVLQTPLLRIPPHFFVVCVQILVAGGTQTVLFVECAQYRLQFAFGLQEVLGVLHVGGGDTA